MIPLFSKNRLIESIHNEIEFGTDEDYNNMNKFILNSMVKSLTNKQLLWLSFYDPPFGFNNQQSIQINKIMNCIYNIFKYNENIIKYKSMFGLHLMFIQQSTHDEIKKSVIRVWFERIRNPKRINTFRECTLHPCHYLYHFPKDLFCTIYSFL